MVILRKFNTILSALLIIIILAHAVAGSLILIGINYFTLKWLAYIGIILIIIHIILGLKFTFESMKSSNGYSLRYIKENTLFWTRRISGFGILILLFFHFGVFGQMVNGNYVVSEFTTIKMISQTLLLGFLFLHIFVNLRPLLISFGVKMNSKIKNEIFLILSIILLFITLAIMIYYIKWQFL
jgi:hypothetical protein